MPSRIVGGTLLPASGMCVPARFWATLTPANMEWEVTIVILGVLVVGGYYFVVWLSSRPPERQTVVTLYAPPRDLSPAMLRFIWKQRFDDRTFWSCALSLVSKGAVTMDEREGKLFLRAEQHPPTRTALSPEELLLAEALFDGNRERRVRLLVTEPTIATAIRSVSDYLHESAAGRWFDTDSRNVRVGTGISLLFVFILALPLSLDRLGALFLPLAMMAPAGYYGFFLTLRLAELLQTARKQADRTVILRILTVAPLLLPCIAAFVLGSILLQSTFGTALVVLTASLVILNVVFFLSVRFPTPEGHQVLNEIRGFRDFLASVERLPGDRMDAPDDHLDEYEKYLPYAVALEVEQAWCDKQLALWSAFHEGEVLPGIRPYYLGMWDGKPVEIVYSPSPTAKGYRPGNS